MDYLFRVKTRHSKRKAYEISKYTAFSEKKGILKFVIHVLILLGLVYYTTTLTPSLIDSPYIADVVLIVLCWIVSTGVFLVLCFRHRIYAYRYAKEFGITNEQSSKYSEAFLYENHFQFCSAISSATESVPYADIKNIIETPNYFCVVTISKCIYAFEKAGFENNTAKEAYQFLLSRMKPEDRGRFA